MELRNSAADTQYTTGSNAHVVEANERRMGNEDQMVKSILFCRSRGRTLESGDLVLCGEGDEDEDERYTQRKGEILRVKGSRYGCELIADAASTDQSGK
jgi:hypothetical protein